MVRMNLAATADGAGQCIENLRGGVEVHAAVGDALTVDQAGGVAGGLASRL